VKTYSFAAVRNIKDGLVTLDVKEKKDSEETREVVIAADTIVMSVGALPNEQLYEELAGDESGLEVYNIGDSAGIANVQSAIGMACRLVEELTGKGW
jgi:predicted dinucleotide-utilizing enzyme